MSTIILRPRLSERIAAQDSRTEAFTAARFGVRRGSVAIELLLPAAPTAHQVLVLDILLDLCLRMDPIVAEVRLLTAGANLATLLSAAALRLPVERPASADATLATIQFAIGRATCPYVDANDWRIGFNAPLPSTSTGFGAGAIFGALEAAKYLFLQAVALVHQTDLNLEWPKYDVFDLLTWSWLGGASPPLASVHEIKSLPTLALVGCGGVGAGYLWFLRKSGLSGQLLLIDDDPIAWHNMNRLFYATIADADIARNKAESAAHYMGGAWVVEVVPRKAEHDDAIGALRRVLSSGGLIASAVGEPETRKFLARRGFAQFFDAATNSLGSMQVLALTAGTTSCIDCHLRPQATPAKLGACGTLPQFAGVVPHLAAYAGALLGFEQLRGLFAPSGAFAGVNTQSILRPIDAAARETTQRCSTCPIER
jgi:hypothetical protein